MVDKQSMYMDLDTLKNQTIRANWRLCVVIVLCNLLGHSLPAWAQSTDSTGHLILVDYYEDDFSTDKVGYDSRAHSVIWVDGAYPPDSPYLLLSQMGSNNRALIFRSHHEKAAQLVYCFPIVPDATVRSFPLVLDMEMEVRFIPDSESGNQVIGQLCYYTSANGIDWSLPTCLEPPGNLRLDLGLLQDNRYIKLEGFNVVIDDVRASTYRISPDKQVGPGPGQFPNIQAAIDAAFDNEVIEVADGSYLGQGNTELRFHGKSIILRSENGPENCIIDCEEQFRGVIFDQQETTRAVLDGFTIQNARGSPGAGIYCANSSPTISNCRLVDCVSDGSDETGRGGGLYCEAGAPLIRDCEFLSNSVKSNGRGGQGGAIYLAQDAMARLEGCRIRHNQAEQGAGIYVANGGPWEEPQQTVKIKNCLISENTAAAAGGGILLSNNRVNLINCTLASNSAHIGGGLYIGFAGEFSQQTQMKDCILWGNTPEDINGSEEASEDDLQVSFSDIGQDWPGPGNVNADPCFVGEGDFHLLSPAGRWNPASQRWVHDYGTVISPCIDAGSSDHVVGERNPGGKLANMGCYGMTAQASRGAGTRVFHVEGKTGNDANTGMSREAALRTIQRAVDLTSDGDIVLIWPGTYEEEVGFQGKNITVQSAADAATVTAPAEGVGYAFSFFQKEGERAPCILRNLIIRHCTTAAIYCTLAAPTLENLTIVENTLGVDAIEPHDISISSCVFWGNRDGDLAGQYKADAVNYCRLQSSSGGVEGEGNIYSNPLFADSENGDFHLQSKYGRYWPEHGLWVVDESTSACIDAGEPGVFPRAEPRAHGDRINMGAHGGTGYASMSSPYNTCDLNRDGFVDFLDFAIFADNWLMN